MGDEEEPVAIWAPNGCVVRLAQPCRALADGAEHGLNIGRGACDDAEDFAGRRLLFQRLIEMFLRLGEFAGSLVKLALEVGCHRCAARRCTGLASDHATNTIDVTTGQPLMKLSPGAPKYTTSVPSLRGLDPRSEDETAMCHSARSARAGLAGLMSRRRLCRRDGFAKLV